MRELKFRAWDKITKRYYAVSGLEYDDNGELCEIYLAGIQIDESDPYANVREPSDVVLEQDTGLRDKNGKEIYEGDIVRYAFEYPEGEWVEEVSFGKISDGEGYYHDYFLAWRTTDKDGDDHQSLLDLEGCCEVIGNIHCEVIGNIHENSELIKEE